MATNPAYTKEFKEGVVKYALEHPNESIVSIAKKFGILTVPYIHGGSNI